MVSAHFVPGLRTYLSEVPKRFEGPTKAYQRHKHLNLYGKSDLKISLFGSAVRFGRDSADYLITAHHLYVFLM